MVVGLRGLGVSELKVPHRSGESVVEQRHQMLRQSEDERDGEYYSILR